MEEETLVYQQAFHTMLRKRRDILLQEHKNALINVQQNEEDTKKTQIETQKRQLAMQTYQKSLKEQILADQKRREKDHCEFLQGIDPAMHGYPHLPQTPRDIRRKREVEKQMQFSRAVSVQLEENQRRKKAAGERELQEARELIVQDLREKDREAQEEQSRKASHKYKVRLAFKQAQQARELLHNLETSLQNPQSVSVISSDFQEKSVPKTSESVKRRKSQNNADFDALTPTKMKEFLSNSSLKLPGIGQESPMQRSGSYRQGVRSGVQDRLARFNAKVRRNWVRKAGVSSRSYSWTYQRGSTKGWGLGRDLYRS